MPAQPLARCIHKLGGPLRRSYTSESLVYKSHGNPREVLSLQETHVAALGDTEALVDFLAVRLGPVIAEGMSQGYRCSV